MSLLKCIIIDDEPEVRKRLESLLKKVENVEVTGSFGEPEKAIKGVINHNPDLVFIDIELPRLNGFEVIEKIREEGSNPTFIFVTAFNQYAIKAIKAAAFDFILKPVGIDELSQVISRFEGHRVASRQTLINDQRYKNLTSREKEIVSHLLEGCSSKEIAGKLFISKNTVDTHRRKILDKLNLKNTLNLLSRK